MRGGDPLARFCRGRAIGYGVYNYAFYSLGAALNACSLPSPAAHSAIRLLDQPFSVQSLGDEESLRRKDQWLERLNWR